MYTDGTGTYCIVVTGNQCTPTGVYDITVYSEYDIRTEPKAQYTQDQGNKISMAFRSNNTNIKVS